ncbi:MAG TPA: hypothetical protein VOB72_00430 [Candidatus Dormibacteraeota bacterium]|nr:hypothetical protein [Candidatus Dormibacteraeota bacterium]
MDIIMVRRATSDPRDGAIAEAALLDLPDARYAPHLHAAASGDSRDDHR